MSKLYPVLDWMKANPLLVGCAIVVLISIGVFIYSHQLSSAFKEELAESERKITEIRGFENQTVTAPGPNPDDPPLELRMVVNDNVISRLGEIDQRLEEEFRTIFQTASEINQQGKQPIMANLFPRPEGRSDMYTAREPYLQAFSTLYEQLEAGTTPTAAEMEDVLMQEREIMLRQMIGDSFDEEQQAELEQRQTEALFRFIREHATSFRVFAEPVDLDRRGTPWQPGPFQVGGWATGDPTMVDLWEGQMELWIQQDLVEAINLANRADDPESMDSVLTLPVKRLLSMEVLGYIGAENLAITDAIDESRVEQIINDLESRANQRLTPDFSKSPTGRVSNPLYDVRHARMSVIADAHQLPALLNAIAQVNLMTVIGTDISDINEYEHLREGYYYGATDSVRVDLVIETIWLRSWTAGHLSEDIAEKLGEPFNPGLMPDDVRVQLGLPPRDLSRYQPAQ